MGAPWMKFYILLVRVFKQHTDLCFQYLNDKKEQRKKIMYALKHISQICILPSTQLAKILLRLEGTREFS